MSSKGTEKRCVWGNMSFAAGAPGPELSLGRELRLAAPKKVLVFGGSFDPPHAGHMNLLACAVEAVRPHRVLVVPSGTAPHKRESETPGPLREAMCACFRPVFPALEISDIELRRPGKSYTYDTLVELRQRWPDDEFYLCVGGDMLQSFPTWHRSEELLALCVLVVHARTTGEKTALLEDARRLEARGGRIVFSTGPVVSLSSSQLRQAIAQGQDVWDCIPPPADEIIRRNHLYTE